MMKNFISYIHPNKRLKTEPICSQLAGLTYILNMKSEKIEISRSHKLTFGTDKMCLLWVITNK